MSPSSPLSILGIDYIELLVGNSKQTCRYFEAMGFRAIAYRGLETGVRSVASRCLASGQLRLMVSSPLLPDDSNSRHICRHGDGVRDVGFLVQDAKAAYAHAMSRGATSAAEPLTHESESGSITTASIVALADTLHSFVSRSGTPDAWLPGFRPLDAGQGAALINAVDHIALAVDRGELGRQVSFYRDVMGFTEMGLTALSSIKGQHSALMSTVVEDGNGKIKFPIMEPATGPRKSQIGEFLDYYGTAGVQHVAFHTPRVVDTINAMQQGGIGILSMSPDYYDGVAEQVPEVAMEVDQLRRTSVIVDKDEDGFLLQAFTEPFHDRPTLFFELIERHGSRGFGAGNVKHLFEAVERDQAARGNL